MQQIKDLTAPVEVKCKWCLEPMTAKNYEALEKKMKAANWRWRLVGANRFEGMCQHCRVSNHELNEHDALDRDPAVRKEEVKGLFGRYAGIGATWLGGK